MNENIKTCLNVWHSSAFRYIIMTACAIAVLWFVRKMLREFIECRKSCEIPGAAERFAKKAAGTVMNRAFQSELDKQ